jgi:GntR family transcriptional repressor for pyruvate dehydrogenase complex
MSSKTPRQAVARIEPVQRFKISNTVAAELEEMIMGHSYAVGDKLPSERALAEQFSVGRSSMREALRILEERGLVSIVHGVGVFVASDSSPEVREWLTLGQDCSIPELFEVRLPLECDVAALAAKKVTPDQAERLRQCLAAEAEPGLSDHEFILRDQAIHLEIVRTTANRLYIRLYERIADLLTMYSERVIVFPGRRETAHAGHAAIVEAIVNGRPDDARTAMKQHLHAVESAINEHLTQGDGGDTAQAT